MQIDGLHQLGYLLLIAFAAYLAWLTLVWTGTIKSDKFKVITKPRRHVFIAIAGIIIAIFQPFKLVTQSDESRTAMRHSFDTPIYQNDREKVETSNKSYELRQIQEEGAKAIERWDSKSKENN